MEIEVLDYDRKANRLAVLITGSDSAMLNAIRRLAMEEVPVLAIEDVEIRKNSSVLYDEMVALRLGLVPLKTELDDYTLPEECKCNGAGCARCQAKLSLSSAEAAYVYSDELKSKDPKVKPVHGKMPIVKLLKGQKIEVEATAMLGRGKQHAKWSPGLVYYKHYPQIKVTGDIKDPELVEKYPTIFSAKAGKVSVDERALAKSHISDSIEELTGGAVKVEEKENDFVLFVESWGQLECREILRQAMAIYEEKLEQLQKELGKK
ncbi:DNA-directed RNA polymerase subunit D [Candidatus Woesearchaeota archaeon]|nr:DNA-directed RNA polymerase subunit D [Candidatus Woesearchaeota archaeon]